jgi:hypothetical protein
MSGLHSYFTENTVCDSKSKLMQNFKAGYLQYKISKFHPKPKYAKNVGNFVMSHTDYILHIENVLHKERVKIVAKIKQKYNIECMK